MATRTHCEESRGDLEPYGFTCETWEPFPMPLAWVLGWGLSEPLDAGFGPLSRCNAAFRAVCGRAPRESRARHRM